MKILKILALLSVFLTACGPRVHEEVFTPTLTAEELENSLSLGTEFLLNHQKEAGNFDYEYDFATSSLNEDDNQVRQAGALWGLTLLYQKHPTDELAAAIEKSFAFFKENSKTSEAGRYTVYPGDSKGSTGTVALLTLSLVDFLRTPGAPNAASYEADLKEYIDFLVSLSEDGQFASKYSFENGDPLTGPSPYFDGETLLALTKAAKYQGYEELAPLLTESAYVMHEAHVEEALDENPDSDDTKGFYQWGSMAFYELYTSDWSDKDYADWTLEMANWMLDVHKVLERGKNTGYAFEGLLHAYEIARLTGDEEAQSKLASAIDTGLHKLTLWQVIAEDTSDPLALGGIRNEVSGTTLRIDVTQHQMHAVILALKFLY